MNLLAALGYAAFERVGEGSFQLSGPAPDWLPDGPLVDVFPFLEVFLPDAEEFWVDPGGSALYSDWWTQNELHFCATAIAGEQKVLLIQCSGQGFQQAQSFVQYAHEASLLRDKITKLTEAKSEFLASLSQ